MPPESLKQEETGSRKTLAGVDEAGLGPILGPLVVTGIALDGPSGVDPWEALGDAVARSRPGKARIQVADSKKVHNGPQSKKRLERTVLATLLFCQDAPEPSLPGSPAELLHGFGIDLAPFHDLPWFDRLDRPMEWAEEPEVLLELGDRLRRASAREGIEPREAVVRVVEVEEWNRWIEATDNKSEAHLAAFFDVLGALLPEMPAGARIVCDRCGGRFRYRLPLGEAFRDRHIRVLGETPSLSRYLLSVRSGAVARGGETEVCFAPGGEDRAFPCALASCVSKYVRELFIAAMNAWFAERVEDLKPTAGYYVDGHRFLDEVRPILAAEGLEEGRIVRVR